MIQIYIPKWFAQRGPKHFKTFQSSKSPFSVRLSFSVALMFLCFSFSPSCLKPKPISMSLIIPMPPFSQNSAWPCCSSSAKFAVIASWSVHTSKIQLIQLTKTLTNEVDMPSVGWLQFRPMAFGANSTPSLTSESCLPAFAALPKYTLRMLTRRKDFAKTVPLKFFESCLKLLGSP